VWDGGNLMTGLTAWFAAALTAIVAFVVFAFSDRFTRYGLRGWKTSILGIALVFISFLARALFSMPSFSELFIPGISGFVLMMSEIVMAVGVVTIAMSMFIAVRRLSMEREEDDQKESQLEFLDDLKDILFEPYSLVELLNISLKQISSRFEECMGAIFIYNPARRELYLTSSININRELEARMEKISVDHGDIISRTQKTSRSHAVGAISNADKNTQEILSTGKIEAAIAAPLMSRNGAVGVLVVMGSQPYRFTRFESDMIKSAANLLGPAVASFRMEREIRQMRERLTSTTEMHKRQADIVATVSSEKSAPVRMGMLLEYAADILRADGALLAERSETDGWSIRRSTDISAIGETISMELARHFSKSSDSGRPILVRSKSERNIDNKMIIFPLGDELPAQFTIAATVSADRESFSQDEISRMQLVIRLIDILLPQMQETVRSEGTNEIDVDRLMNIVNSSNIEELAKSVGSYCDDVLHEYDSGIILMNDSSRQRLTAVGSFGLPERKAKRLFFDSNTEPWKSLSAGGAGRSFMGDSEIQELVAETSEEQLRRHLSLNDSGEFPQYVTVEPLISSGRCAGFLYLDGNDEPPSKEREIDRLFLAIVAERLSSITDRSKWTIRPEGITDNFGVELVERINEVNNALTGIIGKAQLLGFGLREEPLSQRDSVLQNLDLIADEAFQAGEIVKVLQRSMRREDKSTSSDSANLTEVLRKMTIMRYGADPDLHFLRDNPQVSFHADLEKPAPFSGSSLQMEAAVSEILQWAWERFDPDEYMFVYLHSTDKHSYLILSDSSVEVSSEILEDRVYRNARIHPELGQSDVISEASDLSIEISEVDDEPVGTTIFLKFGREKQSEDAESDFRILAIDDQEIIRELLSGMLEQLGYDVNLCETGEEGVREFLAGDYDLVITDIGLPDIDGWEVVDRIRQNDSTIPIIMISGWGLGREVERAKKVGIEHILPKPFRLENLSELIEDVKSRRAIA